MKDFKNMNKEELLNDENITPELTDNVKNALSKFKTLTLEQKSTLMGGFKDSYQDNGVGEDTFPNIGG